MKHTQELILVVALLAKRPDTFHTLLLLQERSSISQVYVGTPHLGRFWLPGIRGEET